MLFQRSSDLGQSNRGARPGTPCNFASSRCMAVPIPDSFEPRPARSRSAIIHPAVFAVAQRQGEGRAHAPTGRPGSSRVTPHRYPESTPLRRTTSFPPRVLVGQAHSAWPVPGRDGGLLVGEEHAIPDVLAACDGPERGRAVEPAVHAARPVAAERAGGSQLRRLCRVHASIEAACPHGGVFHSSYAIRIRPGARRPTMVPPRFAADSAAAALESEAEAIARATANASTTARSSGMVEQPGGGSAR